MLEIKVSGHILERDFLGYAHKILRDKDCDISDIEIFVPTLKGGWNEQCPSVMVFKLVPELEASDKKSVEECYNLLRDALRQLNCRLIYCKELGYTAPHET